MKQKRETLCMNNDGITAFARARIRSSGNCVPTAYSCLVNSAGLQTQMGRRGSRPRATSSWRNEDADWGMCADHLGGSDCSNPEMRWRWWWRCRGMMMGAMTMTMIPKPHERIGLNKMNLGNRMLELGEFPLEDILDCLTGDNMEVPCGRTSVTWCPEALLLSCSVPQTHTAPLWCISRAFYMSATSDQ